MHTIVVFDSLRGNTEQIARSIGAALACTGDVRVLRTTELTVDTGADAWVIGGPTHNHGLSRPLGSFLDAFPRGSLRGVPVATFDTRYHYPSFATGSAARRAAQRLRRTGCRLVAEPQSFFVEEGPKPEGGGRPDPASERLQPGELERARAWGERLAGLLGAS